LFAFVRKSVEQLEPWNFFFAREGAKKWMKLRCIVVVVVSLSLSLFSLSLSLSLLFPQKVSILPKTKTKDT
jgi:hypothetical protein